MMSQRRPLAIAFANDVLDEYERMKATVRAMIAHNGQNRDGTCTIGNAGCTWFVSGDGGYHYSMFALSKGLGQYGPADLADPKNFYAKVVDLLLTEQKDDGSWPADLRDDGTILGATAFSIMSLGRVGQPPTIAGTVYGDGNRSGTRDAGEPGQPGWTVYLDVNNNGGRDPGEPSAVTGADGTYLIQNLPEGRFTVRPVVQAGWDCTGPAGCAYTNDLKVGARLTGQDFGVAPTPSVTVTVAGSRSGTQCASTRRFRIRLHGVRARQVKSATVRVNGKKARVRRVGRRLTSLVDLRKLAPGRYKVTITVVLRNGKRLHGTRRYRTCTPKIRHRHRKGL
jgi:hypothetical protein